MFRGKDFWNGDLKFWNLVRYEVLSVAKYRSGQDGLYL